MQLLIMLITREGSRLACAGARQREKENACDMPFNGTVHAVRVHARVIVVLVSYRSKDCS
jgi:hypothetical protein